MGFASVKAAGAFHRERRPFYFGERRLDHTLDRREVRLHLPAVIVGAVVTDRDPDTA
jgi:hypothetical protein